MNTPPPIEGMKKVPMGLPLMMEAWASFIAFSASLPEARAAFTAATGLKLEAFENRSPMDAAIDKATGFDRHVLTAFMDWVTEFHWGEEGKEYELE